MFCSSTDSINPFNPIFTIAFPGQQREKIEIQDAASMINLLKARAPEAQADAKFVNSLIEFYREHQVEKVFEEVEKLAIKYFGREDALLDKLEAKYGQRPLVPSRDEL